MDSCKNKLFSSLIPNPLFWGKGGMVLRFSMCSSAFFENTMISSRYIMTNFNQTDSKLISIVHWNDSVALRRPNGIYVNFCSPWCNEKGILHRSNSLISICQYPELPSNVERTLKYSIESINWSIR